MQKEDASWHNELAPLKISNRDGLVFLVRRCETSAQLRSSKALRVECMSDKLLHGPAAPF